MSESKIRLDKQLVRLGLTTTRSQAENLIKLDKVKVNNSITNKPGYLVSSTDKIILLASDQFVSRAALKLKSVSKVLGLNFKNATVLDVGSSTGGFTEFALKNNAKKVIAVDVGTQQMHPKISSDNRVELYEKTDIRMFKTSQKIDIVLIDVSFISLQKVLPAVKKLISEKTLVVAMLKPQFEAGAQNLNNGVVKNDSIRRQILKDFESWVKRDFAIIAKADSEVAGSKGNVERFYLLKILAKGQ